MTEAQAVELLASIQTIKVQLVVLAGALGVIIGILISRRT